VKTGAHVTEVSEPVLKRRWPAHNLETRKRDTLRNHDRNSRLHSPTQIAQIAASIQEWGWTMPVLIDETGTILAGHARVSAAAVGGIEDIPCLVALDWNEEQKRAYIIADNKLTENGAWDRVTLADELQSLDASGFDLDLTGFDEPELAALLAPPKEGKTNADDVPEVQPVAVSAFGDIWILGGHRLMCGDSTDPAHVGQLMNGETAQLLHADPPYGMGKEADGIENDNLYREKLDEFQMKWWQAFRPYCDANASAYIWGNAPDLWRLWYAGGLGTSERFEFRNEIVWDKTAIPGMASALLTQFPIASERCLFFQFGEQFLGNINTEDYPETWEVIRVPLASEAQRAGITPADIKRVCGCGMYAHWFTKSQFTLIPAPHYKALAQAYPGHFTQPWTELKAEWDRVKGFGRIVINGKNAGARSYFNNAHDSMYDIWQFKRVVGEERFGHATPKPVAMMERAILSACPPCGITIEPFGGSGSTLMGGEVTQRRVFMMELQPRYVDVTVRRWQAFTGEEATLQTTGETFSQREAAAGAQA
jgi:DNA modification methylase